MADESAPSASRLPPSSRRACRPAAQPRHRRPPRRPQRDARRAWPPPRRTGRNLLAVPPVRLRRAGLAGRLAPLGAREPRVRARARMGGGADAVALVRPLAVDALRLGARAQSQARPRRSCWLWRSPISRCAAASGSASSGCRGRSPRAASSSVSLKSSRADGGGPPPSPLPPPAAASRSRRRADRRFSLAPRGRRARASQAGATGARVTC